MVRRTVTYSQGNNGDPWMCNSLTVPNAVGIKGSELSIYYIPSAITAPLTHIALHVSVAGVPLIAAEDHCFETDFIFTQHPLLFVTPAEWRIFEVVNRVGLTKGSTTLSVSGAANAEVAQSIGLAGGVPVQSQMYLFAADGSAAVTVLSGSGYWEPIFTNVSDNAIMITNTEFWNIKGVFGADV